MYLECTNAPRPATLIMSAAREPASELSPLAEACHNLPTSTRTHIHKYTHTLPERIKDPIMCVCVCTSSVTMLIIIITHSACVRKYDYHVCALQSKKCHLYAHSLWLVAECVRVCVCVHPNLTHTHAHTHVYDARRRNTQHVVHFMYILL